MQSCRHGKSSGRGLEVDEVDRYGWIESVSPATIAIVAGGAEDAEELLERLGPIEPRGRMPLEGAYELDGTLYDGARGGGRSDEVGVFQVDRLLGTTGLWWVTVEPNGWRCSMPETLLRLAAGEVAASFFWNVNAVMRVLVIQDGEVAAEFDPLLDDEGFPLEGEGLPFEDHPAASAMLILERVTGVRVEEVWLAAEKPTYLVTTPAGGTAAASA
jgi:hypothetical protein